jgi:hypothetical protein
MASKIIIPIVFFQIFMANAGHVTAQSKFEFGIRLDALTIPVNFGTFTEYGPGYYDIHAKGNITQAAYLDLTYWPLKHWGVSLGVGVHSFHSEIEYLISDISHFTQDTELYRHDQIKSVGIGPLIALQYRNDRFRARAGLMVLDFSKQEYPVRLGSTGIYIFDGSGVVAQVEIEEYHFWNGFYQSNYLFKLDFSYEVLDNLSCRIGFETTFNKDKYYPYRTMINGFTIDDEPEIQVLNDFKMSNTYSAFSVGVEYVIGFGKYGKDKNIDDNAD